MRTVERLSYFQFYPADYLLDAGDLTQAEHGAYLLLMFRYYWDGALLKKNIYRDCKTDAERANVDSVIARYFHSEGEAIIHNRVARELERLARYVEHQSRAGKASGVARGKKPKRADRPQRINGSQHGFAEFYAAYPRREKRAEAEKVWIKIAPDAALTARIMQAVEAQKRSPQWAKDGGAFIPHPASWLNGKRWEDEAPKPPERRVAI